MIGIFKYLEMVYAELPFEADECQVIFVDNGADHRLNRYVKEHIKDIKNMFRREGLDFCYMPAMFDSDSKLSDQVHYLMPWRKGIDIEALEKIRTLQSGELIGAVNRLDAGAGVAYTGPNEEIVMKIDISQPNIYWNQFEEIAKAYGQNVRMTLRSKEKYDPCLYELFDTLVDRKPKGVVREIIEKALGNDIVLSKVVVGRSCDLSLPDYNIKIHLRPMEMVLFVLFLRHPEGLTIKRLEDNRDEILKIYRKYTTFDEFDDESSIAPIERLFDIGSNAINEHRSRLKLAFEREFDSVVAQNYYITGKKGEKMQITLPRKLVKWEVEI